MSEISAYRKDFFIAVPIPAVWDIVDDNGNRRPLQSYNHNNLPALWVEISEAALFLSANSGCGLSVTGFRNNTDNLDALLEAYENEVKIGAAQRNGRFTTTHRILQEHQIIAKNCSLLAGLTGRKGFTSFDIYLLARDNGNTNWILNYQLNARYQDEWQCAVDALGLHLPDEL